MRVLVTGATGTLGGALCARLEDAGHDVLPSGRDAARLANRFPNRAIAPLDFTRAVRPSDWESVLRGVAVVVNCAGVARETPDNGFDAVHTWAPRALFAAAMAGGVRRVVQVSARGADEGARGRRLLTKKWADDELVRLDPDRRVLAWCVVRPCLIDAPPAVRDTPLAAVARHWPTRALPILTRRVRPVAIGEAARIVAELVASPDRPPRHLDLVGPAAMPLGAYLNHLRTRMGLPPKTEFMATQWWGRCLEFLDDWIAPSRHVRALRDLVERDWPAAHAAACPDNPNGSAQ